MAAEPGTAAKLRARASKEALRLVGGVAASDSSGCDGKRTPR